MQALIKDSAGMFSPGDNWSQEKSQGFLDGETSRRRGTRPSLYAMVGIDDYCLGFRIAYFMRSAADPGHIDDRDPAHPAAGTVRDYPVAASSEPPEYPQLASN